MRETRERERECIYTYISICAHGPVGWGSKIHQLHLCRTLQTRVLDMTLNYLIDEVSVMLKLWGMWSTLLLPSLSGSLWPRVVAPDRVLSMG